MLCCVVLCCVVLCLQEKELTGQLGQQLAELRRDHQRVVAALCKAHKLGEWGVVQLMLRVECTHACVFACMLVLVLSEHTYVHAF